MKVQLCPERPVNRAYQDTPRGARMAEVCDGRLALFEERSDVLVHLDFPDAKGLFIAMPELLPHLASSEPPSAPVKVQLSPKADSYATPGSWACPDYDGPMVAEIRHCGDTNLIFIHTDNKAKCGGKIHAWFLDIQEASALREHLPRLLSEMKRDRVRWINEQMQRCEQERARFATELAAVCEW